MCEQGITLPFVYINDIVMQYLCTFAGYDLLRHMEYNFIPENNCIDISGTSCKCIKASIYMKSLQAEGLSV